jgi:hypothetical protein
MSKLVLVPLPAPIPDIETLPTGAVRRVIADASPGFPCRRCLRDAEPGEELLLLAYDPFLGTSPYRQAGPVFVHTTACAPHGSLALTDGVPDQLARRLLSVRAFDAGHMMLDAVVTPGTALVDVAERLFTRGGVAYLHVHNAGPGCFAARIDGHE